jgi:hypothetical protein
MTFVYHLVFGVVAIESCLLFLLLVPLGLVFQHKLCTSMIRAQSKFKIFLIILFALVALLFVDSTNTALTSNQPNKIQQNIILDPYSHCKVFYAQRNAYLTFISMLIGAILYRIPQMVLNNFSSENNSVSSPIIKDDKKENNSVSLSITKDKKE